MSRVSDKFPVLCIVGKIAALVLLVPFAFSIFPFLWNLAVYGEDDIDEATYVRWCDEDYYKREYGDLLERLQLSKLYGEPFEVYWEVTDATVAYEEFLQWHRAEKKGIEGSTEMAERYYNEVLACALGCRFERNRSILDGYAKEVKELRMQDIIQEGVTE